MTNIEKLKKQVKKEFDEMLNFIEAQTGISETKRLIGFIAAQIEAAEKAKVEEVIETIANEILKLKKKYLKLNDKGKLKGSALTDEDLNGIMKRMEWNYGLDLARTLVAEVHSKFLTPPNDE